MWLNIEAITVGLVRNFGDNGMAAAVLVHVAFNMK